MVDNWFSTLISTMRDVMASRRTSSAIKPFYPLVFLIAPLCFYLAKDTAVTAPSLSIFFITLGSLALLAFIVGLFYFAIKDPERLQSESYLLRQRSFDLIEEKGGKIALSPSLLEMLSNPDSTLPPKDDREQAALEARKEKIDIGQQVQKPSIGSGMPDPEERADPKDGGATK